MNPNIRTGKVEGTGAAVDVVLGFVPDYVEVVNVEDGDAKYQWFKGMTDGHAIQSVNNAATQFSRITANGISELEGEDGAGFTIGSAISENGKDLYYLAVRNGVAA